MTDFQHYPALNMNLDLLENALYTGDRSWYYPNIISPFNRIYFMIHGNAYLENEHGHIPLLPGHMYLIPADTCYTYVCTNIIHKYYIHFNLELFPGTDLFSRFDRIQEMPYSPNLLTTILSETENESFLGLLHLKSIFWQVVYEFFRKGTDSLDYMGLFTGFYRQRLVLDFLSDHLNAALRIKDIALALDMPVHQLSRAFRQDTGKGLKEYMEQMLLKQARHLLLHTTMSVSQISDTLGFTDPFYFSRFFKKKENCAPRDYRKQIF